MRWASSSEVPERNCTCRSTWRRAPAWRAAQLVEADDAALGEGRDHVADGGELGVGQRLVDEHPRGAREDPHAGDRDHRGHHERDDGIEPVPAGDRDDRQRHEHAARAQHVGASGARRRRPAPASRSPRRARESVRETSRFTTIDTASTAMPTPRRCTPRALDQVAHGLEGDDHAADEDEHALDGRGHVLDLLVAVGVRLVGRHVGRAHREERDDRGDEVGGRVQGLGQQRDRARDDAGDRLQQDERRVRGDRERRGAGLGRSPLIGSPALASRRWLSSARAPRGRGG